MEDNTSSDDEIQDSPISPKMGGKKLKLNDGSSQESLKESGSSNKEEKDENVDSGVSADKSESTSSDDRTADAGEGPSNQFINAAPTSSNIQAILLNIRRPRRLRNYRKRKTPDRDSDSNDSSRDSDDLSAAESATSMPNTQPTENDSNSDAESEDINRLMSFSEGSASSSSSSNSSDSYGSEDLNVQSGDTDSEYEGPWNRERDIGQDETDDQKVKVSSVLGKTRPSHNFILPREIIKRETGLTAPLGKTIKSDLLFERKFYGSLHSVYRMKKLHNLQKHKGCVNSINFHPEGNLLASGSDDMNVVVWDWARNVPLQTVKTGHKSNVFQSKFLHLNARSQLNIVTCARDGQVRLVQCPPSGGAGASRRRLASHARAAHKLHVSAHEPHLVVSAGEDGLVLQCDVRADHAARLFQVKYHGITIPLYSVCGHPIRTEYLLVAGRDKFVRVYDRRAPNKPYACYSPSTFEDCTLNNKPKKNTRMSTMHLTCAVYSHDGSEILGSYNDEDIYLFDATNDVFDKDNPSEKEGYTHRYSGHRNIATFKGVAFFGPASEYVVSGSDCSYIYMWDKRSEAIVQWVRGDVSGVVNCIETHPRSPVMATSGLDPDVKIWIPRNHKDPTFDGLEKIVRKNIVLGSEFRSNSPLFADFLPALYTAWRSTESRVYADRRDLDNDACTAM